MQIQGKQKPTKRAGKRKRKWDLKKKIESKVNYVKVAIEQKFSHIDEFTDSLEDIWGKVKKTLLDIQNYDIDKIETTPRKARITEARARKWKEEEERKLQT